MNDVQLKAKCLELAKEMKDDDQEKILKSHVLCLMYFTLTIIFEQEDDVWTATCEELGTATFGDSFEEAKENIKDAIDVHINTLKEVGELFKFFEEHNISFIDKPIKLL